MEPIQTTLEYVRDLPLYQHETPYQIFFSEDLDGKVDRNDQKLNTLEVEEKPAKIYDLRSLGDLAIAKYGFDTVSCNLTPITLPTATAEGIQAYQAQTEDLLSGIFKAEKVISYDCRLRRNSIEFSPGQRYNVNDPMFVDLPVRGVHNHTYEGAPPLITKVLEETGMTCYLDKKYRFRIVNTWRPLIEKLEDMPLAVCDYRTLDINDLVAVDRIYGQVKTQVYFLKYNPRQRWYWFSHQTPNQLLLMLLYDTKPPQGHANFCPHGSFHNPNADKAILRESIETRNIIITLA